MSDSPISFKTYRCTRHQWAGFGAFHGEYDGLTTGLYTHAHLQILVPLKGRIHVAVAGEAHLLGPERAIALLPDTAHAASTLGGAFEFLAINAPGEWLPKLSAELSAGVPDTGAVVLGDPGVWLQARQLAQALDRPEMGLERQLSAGVEQLGLYLVRAVASRAAPVERAIEFERAVAAMLTRYAEDLRVETLARELSVSRRQLERRFKAALGLSPRRFLIDVRLAAARDLLIETDLAVEAIGVRVGFGDASHFTRTFRQTMGVTPGAFRQARRAGV